MLQFVHEAFLDDDLKCLCNARRLDFDDVVCVCNDALKINKWSPGIDGQLSFALLDGQPCTAPCGAEQGSVGKRSSCSRWLIPGR